MNAPISFVTGANGFIGRALCARLIRAGHEVRALTRSPDSPLPESNQLTRVVGDLLHPATYREALVGANYVFHVGGDPKFGNGQHYDRINRQATEELLQEVHKCSVDKPGDFRRFVYISTLGAVDRPLRDDCLTPLTEQVSPHPSTDYGKSKLAAELSVQRSEVPWTIVRPTLITGAEMREDSHVSAFVAMALDGKMISRFALPGRMAVTHVEDLVDAFLLCGEAPDALRETFFAGAENISLGQIFKSARSGAAHFPMPVLPGFRGLLRWAPYPVKCLLLDAMAVDSRKLRHLGWQPRVSAQAAVDEIVSIQKARRDYRVPVSGLTIVTGAASGLGRAMAEKLAQLSRNLVLVDKNAKALDEVLTGQSGVRRIAVDFSNSVEYSKFLDDPFWTENRVDEIYACAGFGLRGLVKDLAGQAQCDIFKVNVEARIALCRRALPQMIARHSGRIVLISSSSAFQPLPYMAAYAASNAAILSFGEALFGELQGSGVEVLTVCPGGMRTHFQAQAGVKVLPKEKLDEPGDVAQAILDGLGKSRATVFVGMRCLVMSLMARALPRRINLSLWKKLMAGLR